MTDSSGNSSAQKGHFPFGESWYNTSGDKLLFTSYERDAESGNDYALARYNVNRLGRFSAADALSGSVLDPQSLNRYSYVENDPINAADPSGLKMMPPPAWLGLTFFYGGFPTGGFGSNWNEFDLLESQTVLQGVWVSWHLKVNPEFMAEETSAWLVIDSIEPVYGGLLLDPGGGGGGPQGGGPGGGNPHVDQKVLAKCIRQLFGVTLTEFKGSTPGGLGSFVGIGPDLRTNHGATGSIRVVNDAATYTAAQLGAKLTPPVPYAFGLTDPRSPYTNFTNNNNNAVGTLITQVHELGHSLFYITQTLTPLVADSQDSGKLLEDCVRNKHGFRVR